MAPRSRRYWKMRPDRYKRKVCGVCLDRAPHRSNATHGTQKSKANK